MSTTGFRRPRTFVRASSNWSKSLAITNALRDEELSPTTVSTRSQSNSSDSDDYQKEQTPSCYQERCQKQCRLGITPDVTLQPTLRIISPDSEAGDDISQAGSASSVADGVVVHGISNHMRHIVVSDSSVVTEHICNGTRKRESNASNMNNPGVPAKTNIGNKTSPDWTIPKWKELENKRLALCQQRVQLERRLFEFSVQPIQNHRTSLLHEQDTITNCSAGSSCGSRHSTTNSHSADKHGRDDVADSKSPHSDSIALQRFQLREDQDPVLWSGPVNRRNQPEGEGRMIFSDGQIYEGCVMAGQREGKGSNVWPNGQVYTGSWTQNSRSGRGTHRWPDGRTVTGPWLNGHLHGRVFFTWPDGATYDGDTVKGQKEGRGIHTWKDGRVYSGQYKNGAENGFGTLTERSQKTKYRGQFKDGKRHGFGMQIWKNKTYDGEWKKNIIHGRGKLTWLTGASYTGDFVDGRYNGTGTYISESGTKYSGQWIDGCKDGKGTQTWTDGRVFHGNFVKNRRHGYGQMTFPDRKVYNGGWENGKRAGHGIEIIVVVNEISGATTKQVNHCGKWISDEAVFDEDYNDANSVQNGSTSRFVDISMDDLHLVMKPIVSYARSIEMNLKHVTILE